MEDVKKLVAAVDELQEKGSKTEPPVQLIVDMLRALRRSRIRRSDLVVKHGEWLLKTIQKSFFRGQYIGSIEIWSVYEQIFIAALDVGHEKLASACLLPLSRNFPSSLRVRKLQGMEYEFKGEYTKARTVYASLLETSPGDVGVLKRMVTAYKGEGDYMRAAEELHKMLKLFYGDWALWEELGDLHLLLGDLPAAAHCFEELVLLQPAHQAYQLRLADVYYSMGDVENLLRARKHYTVALNMQAARLNLRALYGLLATGKRLEDAAAAEASAVVSATSVAAAALTAQEKAVNTELLAVGREQLQRIADAAKGRDVGAVLAVACDVL